MKATLTYITIVCLAFLSTAQNSDFITTWQTTANNETITIPTFADETYNYTVDWGDGTTNSNLTAEASHTYTSAGTYDISITGLFPQIYFQAATQDNRDKIIDVKQWGNNSWGSMLYAFFNCSNIEVSATDAPDLTNVTNLYGMFRGATTFNQPINHWDVSNVTEMSEMFSSSSTFNQPLDNWDISNLQDMRAMFFGASSFNQPLDNWDVSNVHDLRGMFFGASSFNQPLNNWNVSNVQYISSMFDGASAFNQPLDSWDVSGVVSLAFLFRNARAFNQPLDSWDVNNIEYMNSMFDGASTFNQPLNSWDVGNVRFMTEMFDGATAFNQPLNNWNISSVTQMDNMLRRSYLSIENYDTTLQGWATLTNLQNNVTLGANNLNYCNGEAPRNLLINNFGWTIIDAGLDCSNLSINDESLRFATLYPNPATDYISISNSNTQDNYTIYNILGKKVNSDLLLPESKISVTHLEKGIYFLKLGNLKALRFVKN
ncbi:BspA family leucine-rich repeat surface protein [Aquimarina rubra]|uniref:BspA family leucine-rich repeat surface protein n=1 Tax=Aquimarina rubra TaxID=1920033 RepID=A0ABW5LME9_9FLAO